MTTTHKTNSKEFLAHINKYILDAIDYSERNLPTEPQTDKGKLQFVADTFMSEFCYPQNLQRYGTYQEVFRQWIMGLPSAFNIDYENYRIVELAKQWGSLALNADDKQEYKIIDNWFNLIACKTIQLMNKHGINLSK